jgi:molybdate transport system regulatory protein
MRTSARNQLQGTVSGVTIGAVMAEVVVDVGGQQVVTAVIKATDVMIGVE